MKQALCTWTKRTFKLSNTDTEITMSVNEGTGTVFDFFSCLYPFSTNMIEVFKCLYEAEFRITENLLAYGIP